MNNKYFLLRHGHANNLLLKSRLAYIFAIRKNKKDPLTPKGVKQIKERVNFFKSANIDLIFSSDFIRTRQTAEIVSEGLNLPVTYDGRFGEMGRLENIQKFQKRVLEGFEDIEKKYTNKNILIVGHRGTFTMLEGTLKKMSLVKIIFRYFTSSLKPGEYKELKH